MTTSLVMRIDWNWSLPRLHALPILVEFLLMEFRARQERLPLQLAAAVGCSG